jgi:hypothetical protein
MCLASVDCALERVDEIVDSVDQATAVFVDVGKGSWSNRARQVFHGALLEFMNIEVQTRAFRPRAHPSANKRRNSDSAWRMVGSVRERDSMVR